MNDATAQSGETLKVPERALLAFREALDRGSDKRMLTEQGKQRFVFAGGVYLSAITFHRLQDAPTQGGFDARLEFDTDTKPYVFAAAHLASMLQLFGGELAAIRYAYGEKVHRVTVELRNTTGFEMA